MQPPPPKRAWPARVLPGVLAGAKLSERATLDKVPDEAALAAWLKARGLSTDSWGSGNTKSVGKLFKELKYGEASVEVYRTEAGDLKVIRSTHVLRGKVCSPSSYENNWFLFNTWQQFGDGRKRTRNGLLSEKLNTSEVPLEEHLHEVCKRAVEEEEMQCVVEAAFTIRPGVPPPSYDPEYRCPLTVERENFVDHTIEIEESKSFPGLLTTYHLYTVDIICSGLPLTDFNTLEFDELDKEGHRRLKYVHAWNWLQWPMIQRYLFEGSKLKETKRRDSFNNEEELQTWLEQLGVCTEQWGKDGFKSVQDLLHEVRKEETQLEHWGRHDGVPLLMRVVHVLQIKVLSDDSRLESKFLLETWQQASNGRAKFINRLLSKKLSCSQVPFDEQRFTEVAKSVIESQLVHLTDVHTPIDPTRPPKLADLAASEVNVLSVRFEGKGVDIEESPSFKGMSTMYHLYTMEIVVNGLPSTDFASVEFTSAGGLPRAHGWRWMTLSGTLDTLHGRARALGRQEAQLQHCLAEQRARLEAGAAQLARIAKEFGTAMSKASSDDLVGDEAKRRAAAEAKRRAASFQDLADSFLETAKRTQRQAESAARDAFQAESLPPAMLSKMASDTITSETFFDEMSTAQISVSACLSDRQRP